MISRYIIFSTLWILATITGIFGGYLLARYTGIGYDIWGNYVDGFCGDKPYRDNEAKRWYSCLWPCFWWSCIRNPANNLARNYLSAEGTISRITRKGNTTFITMVNGKKYFFYYKESGYKIKLGWKFWESQIEEGMRYKAAFVLNP